MKNKKTTKNCDIEEFVKSSHSLTAIKLKAYLFHKLSPQSVWTHRLITRIELREIHHGQVLESFVFPGQYCIPFSQTVICT